MRSSVKPNAHDQSLSAMLRRVAGLISGGMSCPEAAIACVSLGNEVFGTPEARAPEGQHSPWFLSMPFETAYGHGAVSVAYRGRALQAEERPFSAEEQAFIEAIAERVASAIVRATESAALRDREEVFSAIVGQARDGITLVDPETLAFIEFNDAACNGLGYSRAEFAQLTLADVQATLSRDQVLAKRRRTPAEWWRRNHGDASAKGWTDPNDACGFAGGSSFVGDPISS
jgi:two-component system sensor histidine kinase/response regulator